MKALITITTCQRLPELKKNILPYLQFCNRNDNFNFVLSLDGKDNGYIDFCEKYNIPLLYSEEREGVGLSKNRVLKLFPDYDYYFFVEDDVELLNSNIFKQFIYISKKNKLHHLSYSVNDKKANVISDNLIGGWAGGGVFSLFTKEVIEKIGGWHLFFAKYKRYGHTEHSYRVWHNGLNPYPFVAITDISKYLLLNDPPHVTQDDINTNEKELIAEEQMLINKKISFFQVQTLSQFYFNKKDVSIKMLPQEIKRGGRYALLGGIVKINAWGNFYFHKFKINYNPLYLLLALILFPNNNLLKHWIKLKLRLKK
jgi:hypothetical protein